MSEFMQGIFSNTNGPDPDVPRISTGSVWGNLGANSVHLGEKDIFANKIKAKKNERRMKVLQEADMQGLSPDSGDVFFKFVTKRFMEEGDFEAAAAIDKARTVYAKEDRAIRKDELAIKASEQSIAASKKAVENTDTDNLRAQAEQDAEAKERTDKARLASEALTREIKEANEKREIERNKRADKQALDALDKEIKNLTIEKNKLDKILDAENRQRDAAKLLQDTQDEATGRERDEALYELELQRRQLEVDRLNAQKSKGWPSSSGSSKAGSRTLTLGQLDLGAIKNTLIELSPDFAEMKPEPQSIFVDAVAKRAQDYFALDPTMTRTQALKNAREDVMVKLEIQQSEAEHIKSVAGLEPVRAPPVKVIRNN